MLPSTIKWVKVDLRPTADGGAVLKLLAKDQDKESAARNAAHFEALIRQATSIDLSRGGALGGIAAALMGAKKVRMIRSVEFGSKGSRIEGVLVLTKSQLLNFADLLDALLPPAPELESESESVAEQETEETQAAPQQQSPELEPEQSPELEPEAEAEAEAKSPQEAEGQEEAAPTSQKPAAPVPPPAAAQAAEQQPPASNH